jgi:hypothetical protein
MECRRCCSSASQYRPAFNDFALFAANRARAIGGAIPMAWLLRIEICLVCLRPSGHARSAFRVRDGPGGDSPVRAAAGPETGGSNASAIARCKTSRSWP